MLATSGMPLPSNLEVIVLPAVLNGFLTVLFRVEDVSINLCNLTCQKYEHACITWPTTNSNLFTLIN